MGSHYQSVDEHLSKKCLLGMLEMTLIVADALVLDQRSLLALVVCWAMHAKDSLLQCAKVVLTRLRIKICIALLASNDWSKQAWPATLTACTLRF